ncbi:MAG: hypothetical protein GEV03_01615 [Streptosporangiales bacterium]|nr:hypothetical protein [Streptosporangiales bacterium]
MKPESAERLARMTRNLEQARQRAEAIQAELRDARYSATSEDRMVTVTVTAGGQLADVEINPRAMGGGVTDSEQLGASIVEAAHAATAEAAEQMNERLRPFLGDSFDADAVLRGEGDFDDMIYGARERMR